MALKKNGFCKLYLNHNFAPGFSRPAEYNLLNLFLSMRTVSRRLQLLHFFPQNKSLLNHFCSLPFLVAVQSTSAEAITLTVTIGARLWYWAHPWLLLTHKAVPLSATPPTACAWAKEIVIQIFRWGLSAKACQPWEHTFFVGPFFPGRIFKTAEAKKEEGQNYFFHNL